jgi:hypothetical protein
MFQLSKYLVLFNFNSHIAPLIAAAGISAASSLYGAYRSEKATEKANANNLDMAKNSIQYKVADAKKAGIHPLYALGSPTIQAGQTVADTSNAYAQAGKSIGQGITGYAKSKSETSQLQNKLLESQVKSQEIDNTMKLHELGKMRSTLTGVGSPRPSPNPLNEMKGYDAQEMEDKVGGVLSELYQMPRAMYNYVMKQIENDPHYSRMPITKAINQLIHSYNTDYKQTKTREPKNRFSVEIGKYN